MSGFQPKNNLGWIFVEIMLQPEINQNTTLKWRQVSNIKSTMVGFWLDFGCLTSQPDFNHGTMLKSGCVPSGPVVREVGGVVTMKSIDMYIVHDSSFVVCFSNISAYTYFA